MVRGRKTEKGRRCVPWNTVTCGRLLQYTISAGYTVRGRRMPTRPILRGLHISTADERTMHRTHPKVSVENVAKTAVKGPTWVS